MTHREAWRWVAHHWAYAALRFIVVTVNTASLTGPRRHPTTR